MKAWHFSNTDKTLGYGDNRKIILGETLTVKCMPVLCEQGLHGSVRILDALRYSSGPVIWRVDITGAIARGNDKICGQKRKAIAGGIDISDTLREFARWCALQVIHLWNAPDIVIEYLKTGDEKLRAAARDAAWDAAGAAARDAAWAAAWAAAGAAARDAAWAAARDAAGDAARAAAGDAAGVAARDAARDKQNKKLTNMVKKIINC